MCMEILSIDWLGLTAEFLVDSYTDVCVVVDGDGLAVLAEQPVVETTTLCLVTEAMRLGGVDMLQELLDFRQVELARETFEAAVDDFMDRYEP